jgi:predicted TIM-barrel fold metal-dependent hydrolase
MTRTPRLKPPPGACDSHIHVYGDKARFASLPVRGLEIEDHYLDDYIAVRDALGLSRTVIIQTPHYDTDNRSMLESIAALGIENARGIAVTVPDVSEAELTALHEAGVRGLRFGIELARGMRPEYLEDVAARIAPLGWHIQYRSTEEDLPGLAERLGKLPVDVVLDHIASIPPELGTDHPAFGAMLRLLDGGRCWVKLSAPYQLSKAGAPDYADYRTFARTLAAAAPERMVWGTNWPHPKVDFMPDDADLLETLLDWVDDDATRWQILADNPARLYGFAPAG